MPTFLHKKRLQVAIVSLITLVTVSGCVGLRMGGSDDFQTVIQRAQEKVYPSLVFVKPIKQQLGGGERQRTQTFGSGIIISPDGLVVTNSHVAKDAEEIKCVLFNREQFPAKIVGVDPDTDLALIKLTLPALHPPLPTVSLGDSDRLSEGQFVMALGSPLGFTRSTTLGIVSSRRRYLSRGQYNLWIQTDAAINPGNSGGPLVNDRGEVIGINTLQATVAENIGFAIPSNVVNSVVAQLREHGEVPRSYTGIQFQALKDFLRDVILDYETGVVVGGVDERSPAAAADLKAGDLILSCNGEELQGVYLEDLSAIRTHFASLPIDEPAHLMIQRNGEILTLAVTPSRKPTDDSEGIELEMWNCSAQEISTFRTPSLAYFIPKGVYILGIRRPGNAYKSGLMAGDIILSVNKQPARTLADLQTLYERLTRLERGKRTALLEIMRNGHRLFMVLDFNTDYKAIESDKG